MKISLTLFAKATIAVLLAVSLQAIAGNSDTLVTRYISMAIQGDLSGAPGLFAEYTDYPDPENAALLEHFNEHFLYDKAKEQGLNEAGFADVPCLTAAHRKRSCRCLKASFQVS